MNNFSTTKDIEKPEEAEIESTKQVKREECHRYSMYQ